jgi:hypothetical protein
MQVRAESFNYTDLVNFSEGGPPSILIESDSITFNHHQSYGWKECSMSGFICYVSHPLIIIWPKLFDITEWDYAGIEFKASKARAISLLGEKYGDLYIVESSSRNLDSVFFISQRRGLIAIQDEKKNTFMMVDKKYGVGASK